MSDVLIPDLVGPDGRLDVNEALYRAYLLGRAVERAVWKRRRRVVAQ